MAVVVTLGSACFPKATATTTPAPEPNPHAREPIGSVRQVYDAALTPELAVNTFRNIDRLFPTRRVGRSARPLPLPAEPVSLSALSIVDGTRRETLENYLELNRVTALLVLQDGKIRHERYLHGNTPRTRWMSMSVAKSITSTLVGAALQDGHIRSLEDSVTRYVPSLAGSAYEGVTVRDVLMMTSGAAWNETYTNPASDRRRLLEAQISQVPGTAMGVMKSLQRVASPGTRNNYNTGETQVAGEIVRAAVKKPLATYLEERIWSRVGMEADANWWLDSPDGVEIGGSGFSATLRDYGRFGLFMLADGRLPGTQEQVLPSGWVREATRPTTLKGGAPLDYGYLWWPGTSTAARRDGAYTAEGIYGQFVYVNPAARVVIVVWSARSRPTGAAAVNDYAFFEAVTTLLR
jgi:CubicO group peptidase (beta-lactamase class C family)